MKADPQKTAVISLDVQAGILKRFPTPDAAVRRGAEVIAAGRAAGCLILHVGLGFEPGHPEVSPNNARMAAVKKDGLFLKGSETARFHPDICKAGDTVVYKHRFSAFAGNALHMILLSHSISNLVLFGFSTSGIVLSTLRMAYDLDFKCVVIKDACLDGDEEVHRVLTEKVFAGQASVMNADAFVRDF